MRSLLLTLFFLTATSAFSEDRYIPHIAQGQGWSTTLLGFNTCDETVDRVQIDLYDSQGQPQGFTVDFTDEPVTSLHNTVPLSRNGISVTFPMIEEDLISGYGILRDDTGCVSMDIVYTQEIANPLDDDNPLIYYATIPIQRRAVKHVLPFYSLDGCETHVAMAGMEGEVRIEATNAKRNFIRNKPGKTRIRR